MTQLSDTKRTTENRSGRAVTERIVAFSPMSEPGVKAWFDMGAEGMKMATIGMHRYVGAQRALLACRTFEDFQKVQTDFYSGALEDYRAQVARMMAPFTPKAEVLAGSLSSKKRDYDDVPL